MAKSVVLQIGTQPSSISLCSMRAKSKILNAKSPRSFEMNNVKSASIALIVASVPLGILLAHEPDQGRVTVTQPPVGFYCKRMPEGDVGLYHVSSRLHPIDRGFDGNNCGGSVVQGGFYCKRLPDKSYGLFHVTDKNGPLVTGLDGGNCGSSVVR